ncbi:MAG TPA: hypothetical protein PKE51_10550 [Gemmatimonadaceae bacterium]|nr:hypothetical protein [Gemmatimonadaceae bacterium]
MPSRRFDLDGRTWRVYPGGFLTGSVADEHSLIFVSGEGASRDVRLTRFSPTGARSREQALAELDERALRHLLRQAQPSVRAPEAGYRA